MQNTTRKMTSLGIVLLLVVIVLWAFGLLRIGPAVVY
jgi:hypothetical protein